MRNIFLTALAIFFRNLCFLRSYCSRYLVLCKAVKTNIYISFSKHCLEFWSDVTKMYFYYEIIKVNKMHVDPWFLNPTYCPSPNCIPLVNTSLINKFLVTDFFYFSFRHTLSDKISSDKIFDGQNISSDKIFDTKPKFRHFCPIFVWLLYWSIGQKFRGTKCFVGQNFWHKAEISTILFDQLVSEFFIPYRHIFTKSSVT